MSRDGSAYFDEKFGLKVVKLFSDVSGSIVLGYNDLSKSVYVYKDGVWVRGQNEVRRKVSELLGQRYRVAHANHVIDYIEISDRIQYRIACDPVPKYINVPNGMIDWESGELKDHSPNYLSTTQLPVNYKIGAECPHIDKFLAEVLPPHCIEFVWEVIGYMLLSGNPFDVILLLYGKGRNGKGTFLRLLKAILGQENCSAATLHDLTENRFRAATLYGKLANIAGDLESRWVNNTAMLKAITGKDTVQCEFKYEAPFEFTNWAVPIYSVNKLFKSDDTSEGYLARWEVIPFPNMFVGDDQNPNLGELLHESSELEGALYKAVQSLRTVMKRGGFERPKEIEAAKSAFVSYVASVREWVTDACVLSGYISRTKLYDKYALDHLRIDSGEIESREKFYEEIEQIHGVEAKKVKGIRMFKGIDLRQDSEVDENDSD